jgi:rare lipoprotein A
VTFRRVLFFALVALALCAAAPALGAERMRASYYGSESGNRTASGERFRPNGLTAAHRTLPFGTQLRVCLLGRCVVVRISDRGPAKWTHRQLDLSRGAAARIGMLRVGVASVQVERVR